MIVPLHSKKLYKQHLKKVFEKNALILWKYKYAYAGSLILFRNITSRKKIPEDLDIAVDRNGRGIKELLAFYNKLKNKTYIKDLVFMTVSSGEYSIDHQEYHFKKRETINLETVNYKVLERLLEAGNIRLEYTIYGIISELFIEKNGNGLTNLGTMKKGIEEKIYKKVRGKWTFTVPLLWYKAIAQGYAMNFLKEVAYNNIYRLSDKYSKPKDGMRLNSIIALLKYAGQATGPRDIAKFIENTVKAYKKIPKQKRSIYIEKGINAYKSWIKKMLEKIIQEYEKLTSVCEINKRKNNNFLCFYKKLWNYKKILNNHIAYIQQDILELLKKDILKEKYHLPMSEKPSLSKLAHKIEKIESYIKNIAINKGDEGFAYFYEMYMFENLFVKPIKEALPK